MPGKKNSEIKKNQGEQERPRPPSFIGLRIGRQREEPTERATSNSGDGIVEDVNKWNTALAQFEVPSYPPLRRPRLAPALQSTPTAESSFRPIPRLNRGSVSGSQSYPLSVLGRTRRLFNPITCSRTVAPNQRSNYEVTSKMSSSPKFHWKPTIASFRTMPINLPIFLDKNEDDEEDSQNVKSAKKKLKLSSDSEEEVEENTTSETPKFLLSEILDKADSSNDSNEGFQISSERRSFAQDLIISTIAKRSDQASKDKNPKENDVSTSEVKEEMEID